MLTLARRTELLARRAAAEQEVPVLQNELAKYDAEDSVDLVRLQRDLRIQEVAFAERRIQLINGRAKQLRDEAAREAVRQAQEEVIQAQPLLKAFATRNQELAEEARDVTRDTEQTQRDSQGIAAQLEELERLFTQTKDRVESVGLTGSVGALLRKQRSALPDVRKQKQRIRARRQKIDDGRFKLFELDDQRRELAKPDVLASDVLQHADGKLTPVERERLESAAENVLQRKREYLDALIRNYNAYFDALILLDTTEQQLINRTEQFITYIDERVFWIRSGKPLVSGIVVSEAEFSVFGPEPWLAIASPVMTEARDRADIAMFSTGVIACFHAAKIPAAVQQRIGEPGGSQDLYQVWHHHPIRSLHASDRSPLAGGDGECCLAGLCGRQRIRIRASPVHGVMGSGLDLLSRGDTPADLQAGGSGSCPFRLAPVGCADVAVTHLSVDDDRDAPCLRHNAPLRQHT